MLRGLGLGREVGIFSQGWQLGGMASVRARVLTSEVKCFVVEVLAMKRASPVGTSH